MNRYEMMIGLPPFYNREQNQNLMFKHIKENEVVFPVKIPISADAKNIITLVR